MAAPSSGQSTIDSKPPSLSPSNSSSSLLSLPSPLLSFPSAQQLYNLFQKAQRCQQRNLHADAVKTFESILQELGDLPLEGESAPNLLEVTRERCRALLGKSLSLKALGQIAEATETLRDAISLGPEFAELYFTLGILYKDVAHLREAEQAYKKGLSIDPSSRRGREGLSVVLIDEGTKMKHAGSIEEALGKYREALQFNPKSSAAYYNIGVIYSESSKYDEALNYYKSAVEFNPCLVEAHCNIGVIHKSLHNLDEAIRHYEKALSINPNFSIVKNNLAIAYTDLGTKLKNEGKWKEGLALYKKALLYNSQYPDAYYNMGVAYGEHVLYDKAIVCYELAIHFNPNCYEAFNNLGVIYKDKDNLDSAIQSYQAALKINPNYSQTLNNLGVIYTIQGKIDEAYSYIQAAIDVNSGYAEAFNNLGVLYRDEGNIKQAIHFYDKCLEINRTSRNASQNRLLAMNYLEDLSPHNIYLAHKAWGELFESLYKPITSHTNSKDRDRVLRIAYISPDFFTHSVSYFIDAILANHTKNFYVICYANVVKEDTKTLYLKTLPNEWKNIYSLSTEEVSKMVVDDCIDILVELTGHTAGNRLDVCAMRPAPVQITYIGYPNTTGMSRIDYRITDEIVDPIDTQQLFVEKLIRMPQSFLCYSPFRDPIPISPLPALTNGHITFGSFNNLAKINPKVLKLWTDILKAIPNSRLVLKCKPFATESVQKKFLAKMEEYGVDLLRIDTIGLIPATSDHLESYKLMDISLDTFPYGGTTTTFESLWMGVPMITLRTKDCHAQNVGMTILTNLGYPEYIANTEQEYVAKAIELASNFEKLASIRAGLRDKVMSSPLYNIRDFIGHLEKAYRDAWHTYCSS